MQSIFQGDMLPPVSEDDLEEDELYADLVGEHARLQAIFLNHHSGVSPIAEIPWTTHTDNEAKAA